MLAITLKRGTSNAPLPFKPNPVAAKRVPGPTVQGRTGHHKNRYRRWAWRHAHRGAHVGQPDEPLPHDLSTPPIRRSASELQGPGPSAHVGPLGAGAE